MSIFSTTQFSLLYILGGSDNITARNNKNIQKDICVSEIAVLSHPNHYSATILPAWLVNTCVIVSKNECAQRLKLQSLTFSTSFDIM